MQPEPQSLPVNRRSLLTYAMSMPVAVSAVGLAATPTPAHALPLPLTPPDTVDSYDVGDSLVQAGAPTMPLVKLALGADGVYTFEMPRLEQGTGIATALAMMIAEEAQVPLAQGQGQRRPTRSPSWCSTRSPAARRRCAASSRSSRRWSRRRA